MQNGKNEFNLDKQLEDAKTITTLTHEISYFKQLLASNEKKIQASEENFEKTVRDNQNRHRKEIKKYIEMLNQKEHEVEGLKKTIKMQSGQLQSLSLEMQTLTNSKTTLESTILKSVESLRNTLKEFNYSFQENDLDKVVLENKYKQLCDRLEAVVIQNQESQVRRAKVERKYQRLKESYEASRNECVQLKFEIERIRLRK